VLLLFGIPEDGVYVEVSSNNGTTWLWAGACVRQGDINFEGFRPELDESRPGEMTLVVSNQDRAWDADYVASPLAGANDAGCRIRVTLWQDYVSYVIFTGTIDRIEQAPDLGGHDMTATIVAVDDNAPLANGRLMSGYEAAVRTRLGTSGVYLPLTETDAPFAANQLQPGQGGQWSGTARQAADVMPTAQGGQRFGLQTARFVMPPAATAGAWHHSFMARLPVLADNLNYMILDAEDNYLGSPGTVGNIAISWGLFTADPLYPYAVLQVSQRLTTAGLGTFAIRDCYAVNDGQPHHYAFEGTPGVGIKIWIDGQETAAGPRTASPSSCVGISNVAHGFGRSVFALASQVPADVELGHVVQSASAPDAGPWLALAAYTGSVGGGAWDTPDQRIRWLLTQAGITAGTIDTSTRLLRGVRGGESPAAHGRAVAASDGGRFWINAQGLGQYRNSSSGAVAMELRDDDETKGFFGIQPVRDRSRRVTAARAELAGGELVARFDSNGTPSREVTVTVLNLLPSDAYTNMEALVGQRDNVGTVYPEVKLHPHRNNRWATVMALEFGSFIRLVRTPVDVGSTINVAAPVEGIRHSFGAHPSTWVTTLSLGIPTPSDFFVLGTSLLGTGRIA
jgi:hypothetical protein